eukprot:746977-Hanusia_phi.AAC.3
MSRRQHSGNGGGPGGAAAAAADDAIEKQNENALGTLHSKLLTLKNGFRPNANWNGVNRQPIIFDFESDGGDPDIIKWQCAMIELHSSVFFTVRKDAFELVSDFLLRCTMYLAGSFMTSDSNTATTLSGLELSSCPQSHHGMRQAWKHQSQISQEIANLRSPCSLPNGKELNHRSLRLHGSSQRPDVETSSLTLSVT